ncbi:hypothetical protein HDV03_001576 [Kappamyces sp. JEL0829]|nr:hypothetical protein HDV03_001576 [Kappamyces sp. JEL0829]
MDSQPQSQSGGELPPYKSPLLLIGNALASLAEKGTEQFYKDIAQAQLALQDMEKLFSSLDGIDSTIEELLELETKLEEKVKRAQDAKQELQRSLKHLTSDRPL